MSVVLTLFWHKSQADARQELRRATLEDLRSILSATPGLREALIFTPATARDIYTDDGASPPLGLQLDFEGIDSLEAAAGRDGALQALARPGALDWLDHATAEAQAFLRRTYPVDEPELAPDARPCSYVVHYPGPAEDANAWLGHYIDGHPPLMRRMPAIRGIEILTPIDWVNRLPIATVRHMQRNRVLFDSPEALTAALQSPIRHELREDFNRLPPFKGGSRHYAMLTETLRPGPTAALPPRSEGEAQGW